MYSLACYVSLVYAVALIQVEFYMFRAQLRLGKKLYASVRILPGVPRFRYMYRYMFKFLGSERVSDCRLSVDFAKMRERAAAA